MENIENIRKAVKLLREAVATAPAPDYTQVALKNLREEFEVPQFDGLPDSAVIVLQKGKEPSVLVDDDGHVVCWR